MGYTQYKNINIQLYKVYIGLIVNTIFPMKNASVHLYNNLPATECEITAQNEKRQASWAGPMRFVDERVTPTTLSLPRYAHWPNYYTTLDFQHVIIFYRGALATNSLGPPLCTQKPNRKKSLYSLKQSKNISCEHSEI